MVALAPLQAGLVAPETLPLLLIVVGLVLSIAEAIAPGAHFIVVGSALLGAGLLGLLLGPFATPFVLGLLVLVFGGLALYVYRGLFPELGGGASRTSDSASLKGQTGRVTEQVTQSEGEVKLDNGGFNPRYSARALEGVIVEGTEVIVVDPGGGNVVTVAALDGTLDEIDRELAREPARETENAGGERGGNSQK